jgi:hypothetical protein
VVPGPTWPCHRAHDELPVRTLHTCTGLLQTQRKSRLRGGQPTAATGFANSRQTRALTSPGTRAALSAPAQTGDIAYKILIDVVERWQFDLYRTTNLLIDTNINSFEFNSSNLTENTSEHSILLFLQLCNHVASLELNSRVFWEVTCYLLTDCRNWGKPRARNRVGS